jgi:hypothetical protein
LANISGGNYGLIDAIATTELSKKYNLQSPDVLNVLELKFGLTPDTLRFKDGSLFFKSDLVDGGFAYATDGSLRNGLYRIYAEAGVDPILATLKKTETGNSADAAKAVAIKRVNDKKIVIDDAFKIKYMSSEQEFVEYVRSAEKVVGSETVFKGEEVALKIEEIFRNVSRGKYDNRTDLLQDDLRRITRTGGLREETDRMASLLQIRRELKTPTVNSGAVITNSTPKSALDAITGKNYYRKKNALVSINGADSIAETKTLNEALSHVKKTGKVIETKDVPFGAAAYNDYQKGIIYIKPGLKSVRKDYLLIHEVSHAMGATEYQAYQASLDWYKTLPLGKRLQYPVGLVNQIANTTGVDNHLLSLTYWANSKLKGQESYWFTPKPWLDIKAEKPARTITNNIKISNFESPQALLDYVRGSDQIVGSQTTYKSEEVAQKIESIFEGVSAGKYDNDISLLQEDLKKITRTGGLRDEVDRIASILYVRKNHTPEKYVVKTLTKNKIKISPKDILQEVANILVFGSRTYSPISTAYIPSTSQLSKTKSIKLEQIAKSSYKQHYQMEMKLIDSDIQKLSAKVNQGLLAETGANEEELRHVLDFIENRKIHKKQVAKALAKIQIQEAKVNLEYYLKLPNSVYNESPLARGYVDLLTKNWQRLNSQDE